MKIVSLFLCLFAYSVFLYSTDADLIWLAQQEKKAVSLFCYDYAKYLNFSHDYPESYYGIDFRIKKASYLVKKSEDLHDTYQQSCKAIGKVLVLRGGTPFHFKMFESAKQRESAALQLVKIGHRLVADLELQKYRAKSK